MRRRDFLLAAGVLLVRSSATLGQEQGRTYRIGWVAERDDGTWQRAKEFVLQGILARAGFLPGGNLVVESRVARGDPAQIDAVLRELGEASLDAIIAFADPAIVESLKRVAPRKPIVALIAGDAVTEGLVRTLARPGGNLTGVTFISAETLGKRIELLKEIFPAARRVRLVTQKSEAHLMDAYVTVAKQAGIALTPRYVESSDDLVKLFVNRLARDEAIYVGLSRWNLEHISEIVESVNRARAPAIYPLGQFVDAGGLATYQADLRDAVKRIGEMTVLVLRGTRPADIPFEQESRFQLILNQKTARSTGVTFSPSLLVRADRVIE